MREEMMTLEQNETWNIVSFAPRSKQLVVDGYIM